MTLLVWLCTAGRCACVVQVEEEWTRVLDHALAGGFTHNLSLSGLCSFLPLDTRTSGMCCGPGHWAWGWEPGSFGLILYLGIEGVGPPPHETNRLLHPSSHCGEQDKGSSDKETRPTAFPGPRRKICFLSPHLFRAQSGSSAQALCLGISP